MPAPPSPSCPACPPPAVLRPSSHASPSLLSAAGQNETKPCSTALPSLCARTGGLQCTLLSVECDTMMSYAATPPSPRALRTQRPQIVPSAAAAMWGVGAQLPHLAPPPATLCGPPSLLPAVSRVVNCRSFR